MNEKKPRKNCLYCDKKCNKFGQIYCSNKCQFDLKYQRYIKRWLLGKESGVGKLHISSHVKRWMLETYGRKCQECGWNKINNMINKVPLELHHIDGNYRNNKPQNLRLLCPNCHSLTPTFRALNKGNGRKR